MKYFQILIFSIIHLVIFLPVVHASYSEHPVILYEKGEKLLSSYRGEPATLSDAKKIFQRLIDKYPSSPLGYLGMCHEGIIDAYRYGDHYDMAKIQEEALPFAVKALELGPTLKQVHEQYASIEDIFTNYQAHQKEVEQRLLLKPDSAETYFQVADLMLDQGEVGKAVKYFQVVLDMNPASPLQLKVFQRLGWIALYKLQQPERAIEQYQRGLVIRKDCPIINGYLGIAYFQLGRYDLSVQHLTQSLSVLPSNLMRQYLLQAQGRWYQQKGFSKKAIEQYEAALQYGENRSLHWRLANMYYQQDDYSQALRHFQRVIDSEPQEPTAYYYAARVLYSLGKPDRAVDYYATYLQLNPDFENTVRSDLPINSSAN